MGIGPQFPAFLALKIRIKHKNDNSHEIHMLIKKLTMKKTQTQKTTPTNPVVGPPYCP